MRRCFPYAWNNPYEFSVAQCIKFTHLLTLPKQQLPPPNPPFPHAQTFLCLWCLDKLAFVFFPLIQNLNITLWLVHIVPH